MAPVTLGLAPQAFPVAPHGKPILSSAPSAPTRPKVLTSGQHEPQFNLIKPYSAFPKEITGPTVWTKEQFEEDPSLWKRRWSDEQIALLEEAYADFEATGLALADITRETFPFPQEITEFLLEIREWIVNNAGFILIQGLPVDQWSVEKSSAIFLAIGTILGVTLSQNAKGHVLGHVKDLGNDPNQIDKVRIYTTTARQFFHTDMSDIVGLLCLRRAKEGGESDVASAHGIWNTLQRERPDVAELLASPIWYFDRKGEFSKGEKPYLRKAIFYYHDGKVVSQYDPYYVKSTGRFVDAGLIPAMTDAQKEAIEVLEQTAQRLALHMVLQVGDIQFCGETHNFHARTAYTDHLPPLPRRHLLRLWLATPEAEGGWKRPCPDSAHPKRSGVQVDDQVETCPLDAE